MGLISVSACGSLQEKYRPGDLAVPSGLFDRTSGRAGTFFGDGCVAHISLADPFCPVLRRVLTEQCTAACAAASLFWASCFCLNCSARSSAVCFLCDSERARAR